GIMLASLSDQLQPVAVPAFQSDTIASPFRRQVAGSQIVEVNMVTVMCEHNRSRFAGMKAVAGLAVIKRGDMHPWRLVNVSEPLRVHQDNAAPAGKCQATVAEQGRGALAELDCRQAVVSREMAQALCGRAIARQAAGTHHPEVVMLIKQNVHDVSRLGALAQ